MGSSTKLRPLEHSALAPRPWWGPVRVGQAGERGEASCAGQPLPCLGEGLPCAHRLFPPPPPCQPTHLKRTPAPASHLQAVKGNPLDYEMKDEVAPLGTAGLEESRSVQDLR